jgi:hypothetical protein
MLIKELRRAREVVGEKSIGDADLAIFLGLYNAGDFFKKIERWLPVLDSHDAPILIVDNSSTDDSWSWLNERLKPMLSGNTVTLVRNPINLGGHGSLALNLDMVSSAKWVMTLHQDDEYLPNHVTEHIKVISRAPEGLGMVSSESRSVTPAGRALTYPRGAWLLGSSPSPADIFIAHLKNHSYPFSGASFRVKMLEEIPIPWHSTAFPDTEIVLRALPSWSFKYINRATVRYLENPISESHSLSSSQRDYGAFLALVRVFRAREFSALASSLDSQLIDDFSLGVNAALKIRLQDPQLLGLLQAIAQESIIEALGPNKLSCQLLSPAFRRIGDDPAAQSLSALADFGAGEGPQLDESTINLVTSADSNDEQNRTKNIFKSSAPALMGLAPKWVAKFIYVQILRFPIIKKSWPQWNFKWRR